MNYKKLNDITGATKNEKNRYYVYGLYEEGKKLPFYIGKGEGTRLISHIDEALTEVVQEENIQFSKKIKIIRKNEGKIIPVIIKFGLTEDEAFMAELALINLINFSKEDEALTNIVSGHASKREKDTISKDGLIQARTLENFIDNYALSEFDFSTIKEKCVFIKINNSFQADDTIEDIYHNVRGVWNISESRKKDLEYALALYRGVCVGVYKIQGWKKAYEHSSEYPFPTRKEGDKIETSEETIVKYSNIEDLKKDYPELYQRSFSNAEFPQKSLDKWRNRSFFYGNWDGSDVPHHLAQCLNKRIINIPKFSKSVKEFKSIDNQAAVIYNDVK